MTARATGAAILAVALLGILVPAAAAEPGATSFVLTLELEGAGGTSDRVSLGAHPDATAAYDSGIDLAQAPAPFGDTWTQAHFRVPSARSELARLARSIVPPGDDLAWELRVDAAAPTPGAILLAWDPAELDRIDPALAVHLVHAGDALDMRARSSVEIEQGAGTTKVDLRVLVHRLPLVPPGPPQDLTARADEHLGRVRLDWTAPASEGSAPVVGYRVYRHDKHGAPPTLVAEVAQTSFVDADALLASGPRYRVSAVSAAGEGERSESAWWIGTALPENMRAAEPDGRGAHLVARTRAAEAGSPAIEQPFVTARPDDADGSSYEVTLDAAGERHTLGIENGGLLTIPIGPTVVPGAHVRVPAVRAAASMDPASGSAWIELSDDERRLAWDARAPLTRLDP